MNMELKMRISAYRQYMGPSANGLSDAKLRQLAGWTSFNAGWNAALESLKPIKREPLSQRTQSG